VQYATCNFIARIKILLSLLVIEVIISSFGSVFIEEKLLAGHFAPQRTAW
jgi:hypothetical protein